MHEGTNQHDDDGEDFFSICVGCNVAEADGRQTGCREVQGSQIGGGDVRPVQDVVSQP